MTDDQAYESYVHFYERLGITPLSREEWEIRRSLSFTPLPDSYMPLHTNKKLAGFRHVSRPVLPQNLPTYALFGSRLCELDRAFIIASGEMIGSPSNDQQFLKRRLRWGSPLFLFS